MAQSTATNHHNLAETIARLSSEGHCGELSVRHGAREDRVLLRSGLICGAQVGGLFIPLGQMLVHQGALTRGDLRASLEQMARSERLQGQLLTEMGLVSRRTVERALRTQLRRRVLHLLALQRVSVELTASPSASWPPLPPLEPLELICAHVRGLAPERLTERVGQLRSPVRLRLQRGLLTHVLARGEIERLDRLGGLFRPSTFARDLPLARIILIAQQLGLLRAPPAARHHEPRAVGRRAYLRQVRQLHPDGHPEASEARRAELGQRLAALNAAYDRAKRGSC